MTNKDQPEYPEFLEETMFADHGTRVLITNTKADAYLDEAQKRREKYPQWDQKNS